MEKDYYITIRAYNNEKIPNYNIFNKLKDKDKVKCVVKCVEKKLYDCNVEVIDNIKFIYIKNMSSILDKNLINTKEFKDNKIEIILEDFVLPNESIINTNFNFNITSYSIDN